MSELMRQAGVFLVAVVLLAWVLIPVLLVVYLSTGEVIEP